MSRRSYPHYDSARKVTGAASACDVIGCDAPATRIVSVQFTWFRSDDGQVKLCEPHTIKARHDVQGLCANVPQGAWK